jgi:UDPglucose 6-dehydrogenase
MPTARNELPATWFATDQLRLVTDQYDALKGVDAMVLVTDWKSFRHPDYDRMRKLMKNPIIFDGRNQYEPMVILNAGFEYHGIGRGI